jgi:hypothetical protein
MIAQQPAAGIALLHDSDDMSMYRIACDCGDSDHAATMWIEVNNDKECQAVELTFCVHTYTPTWKKGFSRIKAAWDILFKGCSEHEHCLILNKQSAFNLANVINTKVKELDKIINNSILEKS